jgi:predicted GNAT family acetyltransferase
MNTKFIIKKLPELTDNELGVMNQHREKEFGVKPLQRDSVDDPQKWTQILLKDEEDHILAIASLWELSVTFMDKTYTILGVVSVLSVIKGQGYGAMVQQEVLKIVKDAKKTAIGFCSFENSDFYRKCGYNIYHFGNHRFIFRKTDAELKFDSELCDVLYFEGDDQLMTSIKENPEELVFHSVSHW